MKLVLAIHQEDGPPILVIVTITWIGGRVAAEVVWTSPPTPDQKAALVEALPGIVQAQFGLGNPPRFECSQTVENDHERHAAIRRFLGGGLG